MPKNFISALIVTAILALFLPSAGFASAPRDVADKKWTFHSGFDNQPRKIMVTKDKIYFFVHQSTFNTSDWSGYVNDASGAIFIYDPANDAAGMQDLSRLAPISGLDMRQAAVDPATGLLVIAYSDGGIDLITPDMKVKYLANLKKIHQPGASSVNAISFDPETHDVWISTNCGYMKIDYSDLEPSAVTAWDKKISDIIPVGNNIFAIIDNQICTAPATADLRMAESFTVLAGATTGTPSRLMPLSPNHVIYLTNNNGYFHQLTYASDKWTRKQLSGGSAVLKVAKQSVIDRVEQTVMPTSNGYYIASTASAFLIERPASESGNPTVRTVTLPAGSNLFTGSYDGSEFWFYRDRRQFVSRHLNGSTWSEPEKVLTPADAPVSYKDMRFIMSDKHGLIAFNQNPMMRSANISDINPMLISSYRNSKWFNLSPCYHTPYGVENNEAALASFKANLSNYPVADPMGGCIDPNNPDILFIGSCSTGLAAVNIEDPKKTPFMFRATNDSRFGTLPSIPLYDPSGWAYFNTIFPLGFDGKNNFWAYRTLALSTQHPNTNIALYCWTPEDRENMLKNHDVTGDHGVKEFIIDNHINAEFWVLGTALRYPGNDTKLLLSSQGFDAGGRSLRIYNHMGTVEDTSDDTLDYIYKFRTTSGILTDLSKFNGFLENPANGDILGLSHGNVYIFNLLNAPVDGIMDARILSFADTDGASTEFMPSISPIDAIFDEYGRLWISTSGAGLMCFTPDYSRLLAHYTTKNSPLPSDNVYGLGWNKDTHTLFMSTEYGIVEVDVDAPAEASQAGDPDHIFMTPQCVSAEYGGSVAFHNIPADVNLRVRDSKGNTIALLERDRNGQAVWHLTNPEGNEVTSGLYTISDASGNHSFEPLYLPVVRNF